MVLIECFTPRHIENISTCLRLKPQKLVMIGKGEEMEEPLKRYRSLLEVDGKKYFNDCMMGVHIDWDGKIKNEGPRMLIPETRNEIDVVLMHGLIPYFISCKNGTIEEEEIYKLSVVSRFFGGPHARVMLIATKPDAVGGALLQRALDMGVQLVPNAAEKDHDWRRMFLRTEEEEQ